MEDFLAQHPGVAYFTIGCMFTLIFWLVKLAVTDVLKRIKEQGERMDNMELNYKDEFKQVRVDAQEEFKKVRQDSNDKHLEILGVLTEVRVEIAELKGNHNHKS